MPIPINMRFHLMASSSGSHPFLSVPCPRLFSLYSLSFVFFIAIENILTAVKVMPIKLNEMKDRENLRAGSETPTVLHTP